jgi:peroxiredoxin
MKDLKVVGDQGKKLDSLYQNYKAEGNDEGIKSLGEESRKLSVKRREIQNTFVKEHPDSYVAFSLWLRKTRGVIDAPVMEPEFNAFSGRIRNSVSGKAMAKRISIAKSLEPGNPAIDFTLPDTSGKMVSLSSFKGRNVLLCFWFRSFVPFESFSFLMTKLNKQTRADNLAIVSVYYNIDKSDWQSVLKENGMTWTNLIDKDGIIKNASVSQVARSYDLTIDTLPQWLLIGPDGKIIGRNFNLAADPVADIKKLINK